MIKRDPQAFQNVRARFRFLQFILRTTTNNFDLMLDVVVKHVPYVKRLWLAIYERQHVNAEVGLHLRLFVQIVQYDCWRYVSAQVR